MTEQTLKDRVLDLAERQHWESQAELARAAGVTRSWVNKIVNDEGFGINTQPNHEPLPLLCWPCPGCGGEIRRFEYTLWEFMPAHCRNCAL